jgi:predicted nucleic acid-binding protein
MRMTVLIDTNIPVAYAAQQDMHHVRAQQLIRELAQESVLVPAPVLVELFFVVANKFSYSGALKTVQTTLRTFSVVDLTAVDYARMQAIMTQYADAKFDFADAALMALSERLNITRVATLDRRDFGLFRPAHCPALELLPA